MADYKLKYTGTQLDALLEQSRSYSEGGTGTRDGEDEDNAKHYAKQAAASKVDVENTLRKVTELAEQVAENEKYVQSNTDVVERDVEDTAVSAQNAQVAATAAQNSATAAQDAKEAAVTAQNAAQTAAEEAATSEQSAEQSADKAQAYAEAAEKTMESKIADYFEQHPESRTTVSRTVVLEVDGWTSDGDSYMQSVQVMGISADEAAQEIHIAPAISSMGAYVAAEVYATEQHEDEIIFTASDKPTEDITVYVIYRNVY